MYNQNFVAAKDKIKLLIVTGSCFICICFLLWNMRSLKELKIMSTSMCFDCLHMAHGVITRVST